MANLPPQEPGQAMEMLITGRDAERGTWYSPDAVREMIAEARREEREARIKALAIHCEKYALITDDESENVACECIHIIKGMGEK